MSIDRRIFYVTNLVSIALIYYSAAKMPFLFFLISFALASYYLFDPFKDRYIHMRSYYNDQKNQISLLDYIKIFFSIFMAAFTSLILSCSFAYHQVTIIVAFIVLFVSIGWGSLYFKRHNKDRIKYLIRKFYFKVSILLGFIYSILIWIFDKDTALKETSSDVIIKHNLCAAFVFINDTVQKLASWFPSPIDTIFSVILNIQIVTGFTFSLFVIAFFDLKERRK